MILRVDRKIYSDSCISKVVYALAEKYTIFRRVDGEDDILDIQSLKPGSKSDAFVKNDIINKLNDFKLRCVIEEETKDIRTIIYAKAFADYTESSE